MIATGIIPTMALDRHKTNIETEKDKSSFRLLSHNKITRVRKFSVGRNPQKHTINGETDNR